MPCDSGVSSADGFVFLPWLIREFFSSHRNGLGVGLRDLQLGIGLSCFARRFHVASPCGDSGLEPVFLCCHFVAGLHLEQAEVRVYQLFLRLEHFGFESFFNRFWVVLQTIIRHAEGELGFKVGGNMSSRPALG